MSNPWEIKTIEYDKTNSEGNVDTTGYGQISILLSKYVLKEKGKGLSSNDFTDGDSQKLDSIQVGAEVNKLETLTINNSNKLVPDSEKNINLPIPTKTSDLINDIGFARLASTSELQDYSDSYVGKSKVSFQDEENLAIGKGANADKGGIALGAYSVTSDTYDVNIFNKIKHNKESDIWEGKVTSSVTADKATTNINGTNLNNLDTVISDLQTEIIDRVNADNTLQNNINSTTSRITSIEGKIPAQASSTNQLADKSFVNSSIQTNTANFRGSWTNWNAVPTNADDYPSDFSGSKTPTTNDYLVIQNASDYTLETLSGTWRFKYIGDWDTNGKNGWESEYQVNEEPLTSEQIYAINSGITSQKVTDYDAHLLDTNNPHSVTASQVGLGNVTNVATESTITQDSRKNITSGAVYNALALKMDSDVTHLSGDVPTTRTINNYDLSTDITLNASDVGALPDNQVNTVNSDGYVTAPTINNANKVWGTDGNGNPDWVSVSASNTNFLNSPITCSTPSATADKTIIFDGFTLNKHCRCIIDFENTNTATSALTLNINSTGAKTIVLNGEITSATNYNLTSGLYNAYYDGTYWILDSVYDAYRSRHCGTITNHTLFL